MKLNFENKNNSLLFSGIILISFYFFLKNMSIWLGFLSKLTDILFPFIVGFSLMILVLPLLDNVEKLLKKYTKIKKTRGIGVTISILIVVLLILFLSYLIIPSIIDSVTNLNSSFGSISQRENSHNIVIINKEFTKTIFDFIETNSENIINQFLDGLKAFTPSILNYSLIFVNKFFGFVIGFAIMVYALLDKERIVKQFKSFFSAILNKKIVEEVFNIAVFSLQTFNNFVVGKIIDSILVGIICFVSMSLLKLEYALLISTIVGITNVIPVFGATVGAIPGIIILFVINPSQSIIFAILILIIQQFDGNVLGPYILGDKLGLPSFWVIFAILIGGGMLGFVGMFIGIPIFAVIYSLIAKWTYRTLENKNE